MRTCLRSALASLIPVVALSGCGDASLEPPQSEPTGETSQAVFTQSTFAIATFWDPTMSNIASTDEARLRTLKNANFNLLLGHANGFEARANNLYKINRMVAVGGLKLLVVDNRWDIDGSASETPNAFTRDFSGTLADQIVGSYDRSGTDALTAAQRAVIYGYNLGDEPLPGLRTDRTIAWQNGFGSRESNLLAYANLIPYGIVDYGTGTAFADYEAYVRSYASRCTSKVISFDYYPFLTNGRWQDYGAGITHYFRNLDLFATVARDTNKNFWSYPLSVNHLDYELISQVNLRFMNWAPIAYGTKGLAYFTYASPAGYGDALVNQSNQTTPQYNWAKTINGQVAKMGPTLMKLAWRATVHGSDTEPTSGEPVPTPTSSTPHIRSISSPWFAVGAFDGTGTLSGQPHLVVVNKQRRTAASTNTATLFVAGNYELQRHAKTSDTWVTIPGSFFDSVTGQRQFQLTVSDGDGELVRMTNPATFGAWNAGFGGYGDGSVTPVPADYDGDGKVDLAVVTTDGTWQIDYAANGFGVWDFERSYSPHLVAPADYDGDKKTDIAVYVPGGDWVIDYAADGFNGFQSRFGMPLTPAGERPMPRDYDGDGKADFSLLLGDGRWLVDFSANGFNPLYEKTVAFGSFGPSTPAPADYDGDKKVDLSIKASDGRWVIDYASDGFGTPNSVLGGYGDLSAPPVPADYDGDGKADISVKAPWGEWLIDNAKDGFGTWNASFTGYGDGSALPVPADYDGDKRADLSVKMADGGWLIDYFNR